MKSFLKKIWVPVFFLALWTTPAFDSDYLQIFSADIKNHIAFIILYPTIALALCKLNNRLLSICLIAVSIAGAMLLGAEYLFFAINPLLITADYIWLFKSHKSKNFKESANIGANACAFFAAVFLVYMIITEGISQERYYSRSASVVLGIGLFCVAMAAMSLSKKLSVRKNVESMGYNMAEIKSLRFIHIVNLICFIEMIIFYLLQPSINLYISRIFFLPWFIYIGLMVYYKDPILLELTNKAEDLLKRFSEKGVK